MKTWFSSLSPRERMLLVSAGVVTLVILLIQGVLLPGHSAARSAADRNALAVAELAQARTLAADLSGSGSEAIADIDLLAQAAADHDLTVIEQRIVDGVMELRLVSDSSVSALAWADDASQRVSTALRTLSISRDPQGGVVVDASFSGATS